MKKNESITFLNMRKILSSNITNTSDNRQEGKIDYSLHDGVMSGFACMFFQDPSILQFQKRAEKSIHQINLTSLFGIEKVPKSTQLRDIIDNYNSEDFREVFNKYFSLLQRGKQLKKFEIIDNMYYCPIDATQYFTSSKIDCNSCLETNHSNGKQNHSHKVIVAAIMHPDIPEIIPLYPEEIKNKDGYTKQDCEINAGKRLIPKIRKDHPQLDLIIGGDDLYSRQPMIEAVLNSNFHYIFVAKPDSHKIMFNSLDSLTLNKKVIVDNEGHRHCFEWVNNIQLNGNEESINVNYLKYTEYATDKNNIERVIFSTSWVTDIEIDENNIVCLAKTGRRRWGIENECFNTLKNQGYHIEHNYGHGNNNLCFNFLILTLIAFLFQQMLQLTDKLYKECRKEHGSKRHMWESLRSYFKIIRFESFDDLLYFSIHSDESELVFNSS